MLVALLLPLIAPSVYGFDSLYDRNHTKNYVVIPSAQLFLYICLQLKKRWVQNFILMEYVFEGKQGKPKIVPLGKNLTFRYK